MVRTGSRPQAGRHEAQTLPRPQRPERLRKVRRVFVGEPLETERLKHERLGKSTALAVFASDNLSSSAYATEEILRVLVPVVAAAAFGLVVPITLALLAVLAILLFSYRQTIKAYPQAGGAYLVTRDNFGVLPAQFAGVALLTDYILTVSVSVSAGTAALVSAFPGLFDWRVAISVGFIALIAWGNLRGVRESGRIFSVPTYFFVAMMAVLLGVALWRFVTGTLHPAQTFPLPSRELAGASLFLVLHAFASGGAAVTGVEAISNGVPAFRPPEWKNARTTLMWMGTLLGAMFLGLSLLAWRLHTVPDPKEKVTVIAQIGKAVFGTSGIGEWTVRGSPGRHDVDPGAGCEHQLCRLPPAGELPCPRSLPPPPAHALRRPAGLLERHHRARRPGIAPGGRLRGKRHEADPPLCHRGVHVVHVLPGRDGRAAPAAARAGLA